MASPNRAGYAVEWHAAFFSSSRTRLVASVAATRSAGADARRWVGRSDGGFLADISVYITKISAEQSPIGLRAFYEQLFSNDGGIPMEPVDVLATGRLAGVAVSFDGRDDRVGIAGCERALVVGHDIIWVT